MNDYVIKYKDISVADAVEVGVLNSILGDIFNHSQFQDIKVPDGFAITAGTFRHFIGYNKLEGILEKLIKNLDRNNPESIHETVIKAQELIIGAQMPADIYDSIIKEYRDLDPGSGLVMRSSLLNPDSLNLWLKNRQDTIWNIRDEKHLIESVQRCFASLYSDITLKEEYFSSLSTISVGVQLIPDSFNVSSGLAYTADPESGFPDVVHISGVWGIGQRTLHEPDECIVYKPNLAHGGKSIILKKTGKKNLMMSYDKSEEGEIINTPIDLCRKFVLNDEEILTIANWGIILENYYNNQISLEWVRNGLTDELYILQVRPEQFKIHLKNNYD
jgi:pyruvate,water dikinase